MHVPDVVGVWAASSVGTPNHNAVFIDVMLQQPIPHQVCRQEVYLKKSVNWELVRGDVKGLNFNEIIWFLCLTSSPKDALLRIIRDRVSKQTIVVRTGD